MKRILVVGAGGSAGINFIHCLRMAKDDFYIVGTDINKWHLELPDIDSRYIVPRCTENGYIDRLNWIIDKESIEFVHSQPDIEVKVLSENRNSLNAKVFLPQRKTIEICQDKIKLNAFLEQKGIAVPKSIAIYHEEDLKEAIILLQNRYKKVWLRATRGAGSLASLPIINERQGAAWIEYWGKMRGLGYGNFMACEFLPGREFAFQSVWENGKLITSAVRERLEYIFSELTPSGQTSSPSVARSVYRNDINEIATKAVISVEPKATGIFCIDLKENVDGIPCITEINAGRFFTTSNFFAALGANMPYIYIKLAYGEKLPFLTNYNNVPENYYWIRLMDKGPLLIKEGSWTSKRL